MNHGGKKQMWEYVILFGVLIISVFAVYQVESQSKRIEENFNARLKSVEAVQNSIGDSVSDLQSIKKSLEDMGQKQLDLAQNIEKLAQVLAKNIEGLHADVAKLESRLNTQPQASFPKVMRLVLENPKTPINMRVLTQSKPMQQETQTVLTRSKDGWTKKTKSATSPRQSLPGLKKAKQAMADL
jgi:predicted transcriptional regulator